MPTNISCFTETPWHLLRQLVNIQYEPAIVLLSGLWLFHKPLMLFDWVSLLAWINQTTWFLSMTSLPLRLCPDRGGQVDYSCHFILFMSENTLYCLTVASQRHTVLLFWAHKSLFTHSFLLIRVWLVDLKWASCMFLHVLINILKHCRTRKP